MIDFIGHTCHLLQDIRLWDKRFETLVSNLVLEIVQIYGFSLKPPHFPLSI